MLNIMKSSTIKTIVVRLTADNLFETEIDSAIFDDPYMEAITQAVEQLKTKKYGIIKAVAECWDKKTPKQVRLYNSYWVLVNASCFAKAEILREKFKLQFECDLAKEPIYGRTNFPTT
jgi:hypothetical protein